MTKTVYFSVQFLVMVGVPEWEASEGSSVQAMICNKKSCLAVFILT